MAALSNIGNVGNAVGTEGGHQVSGKVKELHEPVMKIRCGKGTWDAREGTECQEGAEEIHTPLHFVIRCERQRNVIRTHK